jgi:hypothetical protein
VGLLLLLPMAVLDNDELGLPEMKPLLLAVGVKVAG